MVGFGRRLNDLQYLLLLYPCDETISRWLEKREQGIDTLRRISLLLKFEEICMRLEHTLHSVCQVFHSGKSGRKISHLEGHCFKVSIEAWGHENLASQVRVCPWKPSFCLSTERPLFRPRNEGERSVRKVTQTAREKLWNNLVKCWCRSILLPASSYAPSNLPSPAESLACSRPVRSVAQSLVTPRKRW